jgi:tetratricopeptide (TPR) repeat protein
MINPSRSFVLPIVLCALSATATADKFIDTYERGLAEFKAEDYTSARGDFLNAYNLIPDPIILYSIAQTYRLESNFGQALYYYKNFLAESIIAEDLRKKAEGYVVDLEAKQREIDKPVPEPPNAPKPFPIVPCCVDDGPPSVVVGAGAIVLFGSGLGFELWAESKYTAAKSEMMSQERRKDLYNSANTKRYVAEAFAVGGLAATGAAVWLYLHYHNRERGALTNASTHIVPTATGFALLGQF